MNQGRNFPERSERLLRRVCERIHIEGPLSFAEFMREALYHPELGYYAQPASPIGTKGDYFTSVSATRLFGQLLAHWIVKWRDQMGNGPFAVYEFGAHQGQLRQDVLAAIPDLTYHALDFRDPLPEGMRGCVLSNELLDALPFHRVKVVDGRWQELFVTTAAGSSSLSWLAGPLSDPELKRLLDPLPAAWMEGYETEVSLSANQWLQGVASRLEAGVVLSIDYGHDTLDYFAPRRAQGGLRCYAEHQLSADPLQRLGELDITADVNFGMLMEIGTECGLEVEQFTDQGHFLLRAGAELIREISERDAGQLSRERNAIHLLTHPQFLGAPFKVLVQRKR